MRLHFKVGILFLILSASPVAAQSGLNRFSPIIGKRPTPYIQQYAEFLLAASPVSSGKEYDPIPSPEGYLDLFYAVKYVACSQDIMDSREIWNKEPEWFPYYINVLRNRKRSFENYPSRHELSNLPSEATCKLAVQMNDQRQHELLTDFYCGVVTNDQYLKARGELIDKRQIWASMWMAGNQRSYITDRRANAVIAKRMISDKDWKEGKFPKPF